MMNNIEQAKKYMQQVVKHCQEKYHVMVSLEYADARGVNEFMMQLVAVCCEEYHINESEFINALLCKKRNGECVQVKKLLCYVLRNHYKIKLQKIACMVHVTHHGTVISHIKSYQGYLDVDRDEKVRYEKILQKIKSI